MTADVEQEALVIDGAADAADLARILFQHLHPQPSPRQGQGAGQACRAGSDNDSIDRCIRIAPGTGQEQELS